MLRRRVAFVVTGLIYSTRSSNAMDTVFAYHVGVSTTVVATTRPIGGSTGYAGKGVVTMSDRTSIEWSDASWN